MNINEKLNANFKSPQQKAVVNTQLTSVFLTSKQGKFMSNYDLTMPQFNILRILRGAGEPLTINTVKERMIEKSPNTTRLLDKLLEKNFISRNGSKEDKRQSFIEITNCGLNILEKIDNSDFSKLIEPSRFSDKDAEQLSVLLNRLRESF
jgi:MarR family 2-MHQ and catechol resistance regulon transcriptional repressor